MLGHMTEPGSTLQHLTPTTNQNDASRSPWMVKNNSRFTKGVAKG